MGLRNAVLKGVSAAFKAVGDIKTTATYRRSTNTYDPNTGAMVSTNVDTSIPSILTGFSQYEIDRVTVMSFDQKLLVEQKYLTLQPEPSTDVVIANGKQYAIIRAVEDPASAIWTLHLRGT